MLICMDAQLVTHHALLWQSLELSLKEHNYVSEQ